MENWFKHPSRLERVEEEGVGEGVVVGVVVEEEVVVVGEGGQEVGINLKR